MPLPYKKITEEQAKMRNVFEKGEYPFSVKSIQQKLCKNNINNMLVVELNVMNNEGREIKITDWVLLDMENMEWKFRHFAATCGLLEKYENDELEINDFLGQHGVAKISIQEYQKDNEKLVTNRIMDYIKPENKDFLDDDIPL